jgi:hypothetical protein
MGEEGGLVNSRPGTRRPLGKPRKEKKREDVCVARWVVQRPSDCPRGGIRPTAVLRRRSGVRIAKAIVVSPWGSPSSLGLGGVAST